MTRLDWSRARRRGGWSYEASPYRPPTATDFLLAAPLPRAPATEPAPRPMTLAALAEAGVNKIAVWCRSCRTTEHREVQSLPVDLRSTPIDRLADAVICDACGGATMVTAFTEGPLTHVGPHRP